MENASNLSLEATCRQSNIEVRYIVDSIASPSIQQALTSGIHPVVEPPKDQRDSLKYTIGLFTAGRYDLSLAPLTQSPLLDREGYLERFKHVSDPSQVSHTAFFETSDLQINTIIYAVKHRVDTNDKSDLNMC